MNVELRIDNRRIQNWKDFRDLVINVERNTETYNVTARLENIELYDEDFDYFLNIYTTDTFRRMQAEITVGSFVLKGFVDTDSIKIGDRRLVMSVLLDEKSILERDIGGLLVNKTDDVLCILERRQDVVAVSVLLVAAVFYLEVASRQIRDIKAEIAEAIAIAATGTPSAPVAAGTLRAMKILLRLAYLALIIVAFVEVFKRLMEILPKQIKVPAINIVRAISNTISKSGYLLEVPDEYRKLWLIGKQAENYEIVELIRLLQDITNSRIVVVNKTIRFIPRTIVPFPYAGRANAEFWRYNTAEMVGRKVISLTQDFTDFRSIIQKHNVEIVYTKVRGFSKVVLPAAPAIIKTGENLFDKILKDAYEFYRRAMKITRGKLIKFEPTKGKIHLADESFVPKLVYAESIGNILPTQNDILLNFIAKSYSQVETQAKVVNEEMYLSMHEFLSLLDAGWPGVRRMSYRPFIEKAEIEYELPATFPIVEKTVIIR